jgi:esterase/lipase
MDGTLAALRWVIGAGVVLWLGMLVLDWVGPTEPAVLAAPAPELPPLAELENWLADAEAAVPDLRPDAAKQIVWAGAAGDRTDWAVVYLHGFSASREELRPVPDRVAADLGANLFFARLTGHGRDGAAMAEATVADWMADTAEALAIGRALGRRVLLIGTSTGATLAAAAALDADMARGVAGIVLVSPNYKVAGWPGRLIEWPGVRVWGPRVVGAERGFEPRSPDHARYWTTRYPTVALAPLGALTRAVRGRDSGAARVPALFVVSERDQVVESHASVRAAARWGAETGQAADLMTASLQSGDDPSAHVLAGDVLSPGGTAPLVARIRNWAAGL